jgi:hypothetical protein
MIREEYFNGGFSLNKTKPVICVNADFEIFVAYSGAELASILRLNKIKICHGVWPGKWRSDCFPLNPESYVNCPDE